MRDHIAVSASLSLCCNSAWPLKKNNKFAYLGVKYDYWISIFFNSAPTFSGAQSPETDSLLALSAMGIGLCHMRYTRMGIVLYTGWLTDWLCGSPPNASEWVQLERESECAADRIRMPWSGLEYIAAKESHFHCSYTGSRIVKLQSTVDCSSNCKLFKAQPIPPPPPSTPVIYKNNYGN